MKPGLSSLAQEFGIKTELNVFERLPALGPTTQFILSRRTSLKGDPHHATVFQLTADGFGQGSAFKRHVLPEIILYGGGVHQKSAGTGHPESLQEILVR